MFSLNDVEPVLAAFRARQAARLAHEKADLMCLAHGVPLPPGWAERRANLWGEWRRAVGVYLAAWDKFERGIKLSIRSELFQLVEIERAAQDKVWGEQYHPPTFWLAILMEEIGEAAKAILQRQPARMTVELIQAMAVIIAWLESTIPPGEGQALAFRRYLDE